MVIYDLFSKHWLVIVFEAMKAVSQTHLTDFVTVKDAKERTENYSC